MILKDIFNDISIYKHYSTHDKLQVCKALDFSKKAHQNQKRINGDDYIEHPIAVVRIVLSLNVIPEIAVSALLHDVLEDTKITFNDVYHEFGFNVAKLVNTLSLSYKLHIMNYQSEKKRKELHHYFLETIKDPRAALIKVSDRLHNMRTLEYLKPEKQNKNSIETIKMYVPLAAEMGLIDISKELHDISKKYLTMKEYQLANNIGKNYDQEIQEKGYHKNAIEKCVMEIF